jgi:XTP/dITP diphosphohydrolase
VNADDRLPVALATNNPHKVGEIAGLLAGIEVRLLTPAELGIRLEVAEDGATYEANALKKARVLARLSGLPAIADDSGLEVEALGGGPGIHSSRFAGAGADDAANRRLLLERLAGRDPEERRGRFVCTAVLVTTAPEVREVICRGEWSGVVTEQERGTSGFGYDPVFLIPDEGRTVAELGERYKQEHSHRARAFRALAEHLRALAREREDLD